MPLARLMQRRRARDNVYALYGRIVAQARQPTFFFELGVPDTVDGRFELVVLHAFLIFERLKLDNDATAEFAQRVFDTMFTDFDRSLREMGVSDLSVGKEVKRMAQAFYGRAAAYSRGLAGDDRVLSEALRRNVFGTATPNDRNVQALAKYVRAANRRLALQPVASFLAGKADYGPVELLRSEGGAE